MANILVIDDEAIVREPIAASLRAHGHIVNCASNAKSALELAQSHHPDLILLDIHMPQRDGLAFLQDLRAIPATASIPVLLLSGSSDKAIIVQAAKLGVQGYILKAAFSLPQLLTRIQTLTAPKNAAPAEPAKKLSVAPATPSTSPALPSNPGGSRHSPVPGEARVPTTPPVPGNSEDIPQLLTRDECIRRVKDAIGTKTLGGVAANVIAMAASPATDLSELGSVISRDPVLSARVLQVANSAAFATRGKAILTIQDAVRQVGISAIRDIAAAMGVFDAIPRPGPGGFNPLRCWQHSLAVAQLSQHLAGVADPTKVGLAYLVGLCHDLGEILLHTCFETEFNQVLQIHARTQKPLPELEKKMLGAKRSELADLLLIHLGLPPVIRQPIESFHRQSPTSSTESPDILCQILRLSDLYANGLLLASDGSSLLTLVTVADARRTLGTDHPRLPDPQVLCSNVTILTGMLARLVPDELGRLLQPLHPKTAAKVFIARHPALSAWDPLTAALQIMSQEVTLLDRLPTPAESSDHTHLAIFAPSPTAKGFDASAVDVASAPFTPATTLWAVCSTDTREKPNTPSRLSPVLLPMTLDRLGEFLAPVTLS